MEDTRGEHMKVLKKTIKTYGKEGKRKYQQIKINKSDNIEDGTVYVLTESQYEELARYEDSHEIIANLKEDTVKLRGELEELKAKLNSLEEENLKYKVLNETQGEELVKLEEVNKSLSDKIETATIETTKVNTRLEDTVEQLEVLTTMVTSKDKIIEGLREELHDQEKANLSQLYSIHNRLTRLSLWDIIRGRFKPIVDEIAPRGEVEEIETTFNK